MRERDRYHPDPNGKGARILMENKRNEERKEGH